VIPKPRTVSVGSDRVVGLYEYGVADGSPVMVFHGVPACGAGFDWAHEPARERGLRLLVPDRPGVPPRHSEELAERLKGADLVVWPDEGHLATVTHVGEILDWLAEE
jgi:pimeloyl-ACP methyl ester carboxylesterase